MIIQIVLNYAVTLICNAYPREEKYALVIHIFLMDMSLLRIPIKIVFCNFVKIIGNIKMTILYVY